MSVNCNRKWLAIGFACLFCACAAKPFICPIIETAGDLCKFLVVRLPDGSTETVPREAVVGVAMQARAARAAGAKASDAGSDQ
jgi:hypothetical protein